MLLYLPERIYNNVLKDDETYANMANEATEKVFVEDFVESMLNYDNDNPYLKELQNYIIEKSPEEYQLELKLCFDDDLEKYESQYNDMDTETKMYWLCEVDGGDMTPSKKFNDRNIKFLRLYNLFVAKHPEDYSNFFHMMYYAKMTYDEIMKYYNKEVTLEDVKNYIKFETDLYDKCNKKSKNSKYTNMLYSKREQMYVMFFEFNGSRCKDIDTVITLISNILYQGRFKYNEFTYFKLAFYFKCFQKYVDNGDIDNAKKHWAKIASLLDYAFGNKKYAIKSLNHYNNSFLDEFLDLAKFLYLIEKTYFPRKYIRIDHLMTQKEKRYFRNMLSVGEKKAINGHIIHDTSYSYMWANKKKIMLGMLI